MGVMVICAFKPKPGKEDELFGVVADHLDVLRQQNLATDRPSLAMRAKDGTIIEVFEWKSDEAIQEAHQNPAVLELWRRYEACSDMLKVNQVPESDIMFAGYEPLDL